MTKDKDAFFRKFREYIFDHDHELFDSAVRFAASKTNNNIESILDTVVNKSHFNREGVDVATRKPSQFVQYFINSWL